jgi:hypothetical protein
MKRFLLTTSVLDPQVESEGPGEASSAYTPTTPGTSLVATILSGVGRPTASLCRESQVKGLVPADRFFGRVENRTCVV